MKPNRPPPRRHRHRRQSPRPLHPRRPRRPRRDDLVSKLTELAKLRDSGVLSREEFEQPKALVLNP
jgi:hypothetical protein